MEDRQYRRLLPAVDCATAEAQQAAINTTRRARRQLTRVACNSCRHKKAKCDGHRPRCGRCIAEQIECSFDCEAGESRTLSLKRRNRVLQAELEHHKQLLAILSLCPKTRALDVLACLRSPSAPKQIDALLGFVMNADPSAELVLSSSGISLPRNAAGKVDMLALSALLKSTIDEIDDQRRPRYATLIAHLEALARSEAIKKRATERLHIQPLGVTSLLRPPICVKAKPWTSITDDDDLVTHLVSLFVVWEAHVVGIIDCERFLEDMEKGDLNSPYCSPFVVNAMCAYACKMHYSPYPRIPTMTAGDFKELGNLFFKEAQSLWDAECGKPSLTNMYGIHIMHIWYGVSGEDRMSFLQMNQLFAMAEDLGLNDSQQDSSFSPSMLRARRVAIWGLYISTMTSHVVCLRVPPPTFLVRAPRPYSAVDLTVPERWAPYPLHNREMLVYSRTRFDEACSLVSIAHEILKLLYDRALDDLLDVWERALVLHEKLSRWHTELPDCLSIRPDSAAHVLTQHILYRCTEMALFGPFRSITERSFSTHSERAQQSYLDSATQLGRLLADYHRLYRAQGACSVAVYPPWALSGLTDVVRHRHGLAQLMHSNIELAIKVSFTMKLCRGMFRVVLERIKQLPPGTLLPETQHLIRDFENNIWRPDEVGGYSSVFPDCSSATENLVKNRNVGEFGLSEQLRRLHL